MNRATRRAPLVDERGHLYLLKFDNGVIKVGSTTDIAARNSRHERESGRYGLQIVQRWNSVERADVRQAERLLINVLNMLGTRTSAGREYFTDVPFSIARYQAEHLSKTREDRCCCGECVCPVPVKLPAKVVAIDSSADRFDLQLECDTVVTVDFHEDRDLHSGPHKLQVGDELVVEMDPVINQQTAWISEMPARLGG